MSDVIVVGAGPIGSHVAYKLAGMGYGVAVVEQNERLEVPVCCTGIISPECISSFYIDDSVILRRANRARLFSPSGKLINLYRKKTQACILDRAAFNVAMARRAQGEGVEYILSSRVGSVGVRDNNVIIDAVRQGEGLSLEAKAVVIANGFGSRLAEAAGLGRVGDFVIGAQAEVEAIGVDEVEIYFGREIAPAFYAWVVPTSPPKALVGLLSRRNPGFYLKRFMLSLRAQGKIVSAEVEPCYRPIPLRPLARTCSTRLIVVGDAAGQVKPLTCGGIYYGLLCAEIAADSLRRALKNDDLSARSLANYERGWRRKLGRELKIDHYARKSYERLNDKQIDRLFDIIKSNGIDEALLKADDMTVDWHSDVVLRLLGHKVLSEAMRVMKIPFHLGGKV